MRILFMGTPDIAEKSLQALITAGHDVCGVVTRQDKQVGRKKVLTQPPVKVLALENDITVFQPKTLRDGSMTQTIKDINPDVIVVVAYGRILPKEILDIPRLGCLNLHVSILPKYRGSAPIQWAVINGDAQTGVTVMYMDEGIDTGDIIETQIIDIDENETSGELSEKVAGIGAKLLCNTLIKVEAKTITRTKQDEQNMSIAPMLSKEIAVVGFEKTAQQTHDLIRGLNPWPIAFFVNDEKKIKITQSTVVDMQGKQGEVLSVKPLVIACAQGAVTLCKVTPEGKSSMDGTAWALGKRLAIGDVLVK